MSIITLGFGATSAQEIAAAVWDEQRSGHTDAGSYGATDEWAGQISGQVIADALLLAPSGVAADGSVMASLATISAAVATVGAGSGTGYYSDTVDDGANPLDGVRVQLSTDAAGSNRVYEAFTNALGVFEMWPDPGTYYRWLDLAGYSFTQDVEVEVTEP